MATMGEEASAVIAAAGIPVEATDVLYELDMHYVGQTHTLAVPLPVARAERGCDPPSLRSGLSGVVQPAAPRHRHAHRFAAGGGDRPASGVRLFGVRAETVRPRHSKARAASGSTAAGATRRSGRGSSLPAGALVEGPAILEQPDATTVIEPGLAGRVDSLGNLIVERAR